MVMRVSVSFALTLMTQGSTEEAIFRAFLDALSRKLRSKAKMIGAVGRGDILMCVSTKQNKILAQLGLPPEARLTYGALYQVFDVVDMKAIENPSKNNCAVDGCQGPFIRLRDKPPNVAYCLSQFRPLDGINEIVTGNEQVDA
jgi:hypothetical protein